MRRKGYAEKSHAVLVARKRRESRRQKMFVAGMMAIFGGCIVWVYWCLWAWANGIIGG